ncbi:terminal ADP-ribose protein glycohydrolase 1 isoform X3 [Musca autumnalis]|uniref:terminal ADP-ribose protein glycohydrolase 1 isoform X3 n=1 Tax=Musca autumnalis TaxID=221902 RepID=UPI003CF669A2
MPANTVIYGPVYFYLAQISIQSLAHFRCNTRNMSNFKITEVDGDLFSAPDTHSLAHCVAADFGMGAGIAVKFKQIFGKVDELLSQGAQTGSVAVLKDNQRFIYYLVTKDQSWDKPTYNSLRSSLEAMREHMKSNNVQKLAIPRIGCGIDGLEWNKVTSELSAVFCNENLEIVVYNFVPK